MDEPAELVFRNVPLRLGTPLRAPTWAWRSWGVRWHTDREFEELVSLSEAAYRKQWQCADRVRHYDISRFAKSAGLGEANRQLNDAVAERAIEILARIDDDPIRILDLGAGFGTTTEAIWGRLSLPIRRRTYWYLLEPGKRALREAALSLSNAGLSADRVISINESDVNALPSYFEFFDLIVSVGCIHHHSRLDSVFAAVARALRIGGSLIVGDWHNALSTHPALVLRLLNRIKCVGNRRDVSLFINTYPSARNPPKGPQRPAQIQADDQMMRFWTEFARLNHGPIEGFFVLEGQRPVDHYIRSMREAGLTVQQANPTLGISNPSFLLPNSELLSVLVAEKGIQAC